MMIRFAAALMLAATVAMPAFAQPPQRPAVPMTDAGLRTFVAAMPSDDVLANRLYTIVQDCNCEPGSIAAVKDITTYLDGLFHHHGYGYGATVYEYLQAYVGEGDYQYEGSQLLEPSGIGSFAMPIINLIQEGEGGWLVSEWLMSQEDMQGAREILSR